MKDTLEGTQKALRKEKAAGNAAMIDDAVSKMSDKERAKVGRFHPSMCLFLAVPVSRVVQPSIHGLRESLSDVRLVSQHQLIPPPSPSSPKAPFSSRLPPLSASSRPAPPPAFVSVCGS